MRTLDRTAAVETRDPHVVMTQRDANVGEYLQPAPAQIGARHAERVADPGRCRIGAEAPWNGQESLTMTTGDPHDDTIDSWIERLRAHARSGDVLDFTAGLPDDSPLRRPDQADTWDPDRRLPAAALRAVLTDRDLAVDPRGLRINGAHILDPVDLENITFEHALHLTGCRIDHTIDLSGATLRELCLDRSQTTTLALDGATVTGGVSARDGFRTEGMFRAAGASIGGQLNLAGATLVNPGDIALTIDSATVTGGVYARDGFRAEGAFRANGASIGRQLNLVGAAVVNPGGIALTIDDATVTGAVFALKFRTEGAFRANGARISGQLVVAGAILTNPGGIALTIDSATVPGGVLARDGFRAEGEFRAIGARIGGLDLSGPGTTLVNPKGCSLILDNSTVAGAVFARRGFRADGEFRAIGARIGRLDLSGPGTIFARPGGVALNLDGTTITNAVLAQNGFRTAGEFRANGASIGKLELPGTTLAHPAGIALNLERSSVGTLDLSGIEIEGQTNLTGARITDLVTPDDDRPTGMLSATGWNITDVHGRIRTDRKTAAGWLDSTPSSAGFTSQPWHALAAVYDRNGQPADARRLRFAAANRITRHAPWNSKPLRWTYLVTAGHGYYPLFAAVWLVLALVAAIAIVALNASDFTATGIGPPSLAQAGAIAAVNVIPAAGGSKPDWTVSGDAAVVIWTLLFLRVASWIFVAILLAGVTGLLRKT